MTLQQLRFLCEIVRQGLKLSQAAAVLHTSQPGVSKQIQRLERELGVVLFQRRRNRILALTEAGADVVRYAERALREINNIRGFGDDIRDAEAGDLVVATTHTHARYTLPRVIRDFRKAFPHVRLRFWQGHRDEIFDWVSTGEADVAIGTDCDASLQDVALIPYGQFHRVVVTPPSHPLLSVKPLTLERIAEHPLVTYGFRGNERWKFSPLFEARQLTPNIVVSAADTDVSKTYVQLGIGIAILPDIAFDSTADRRLRARDARHLFGTEVTHVGLKRDRFIRSYVYEFLGILSPALTRAHIARVLDGSAKTAS